MSFAILKKILKFIFLSSIVSVLWKASTWVDLKSLRLDIVLKPLDYEIVIQPYVRKEDGPKQFTFDGDVQIKVLCKASTGNLMIHGKGFTFAKAEYWNGRLPESRNRLVRTRSESDSDILKFKFLRKLLKGNTYVIHFRYSGKINSDTRGLYWSHYKNDTSKRYVATFSQPIHAREIFPCFDEPNYKATFRLSLVRHKSLKKSYSNTRLQKTMPEYGEHGAESEYVRDIFLRTPPMSTYHLSFIIGNFSEHVPLEKSELNLRLVTEPLIEPETDEVQSKLELSEKIVRAFSNYFALDYVDLGIDQLQIANVKLRPDAMENWGLVVVNNKHNISAMNSLLLAHEIAHMWLGNLVTFDYWSFSWMHEGFATYMSYVILNGLFPESLFANSFVVNIKQSIMAFDASDGSNNHALSRGEAVEPSFELFDRITYLKGAAFIQMVGGIIGPRKFQRSLQEYLRKFQYSNARPNDLFLIWAKYMPEEAKHCALQLFRDYDEKVGFAMVSVSLVDAGNAVVLSQKRFSKRSEDKEIGQDTQWVIPLTYQTDKNLEVEILFYPCQKGPTTSKMGYFKLKSKNVKWIVANVNASGYYRVNYNPSNWRNVKEALITFNWSGIDVLTRSQLVDDLFALSYENAIAYDLALEVLEYLKTESSYFVWKPACNGFRKLLTKININQLNGFEEYLRNLSAMAYGALDFVGLLKRNFLDPNGEARFSIDQDNHAQLLNLACKYAKRQDCIKLINTILETEQGKLMKMSRDLRIVIYCLWVKAESFEPGASYSSLLHKLEIQVPLHEDKVLFWKALSCLSNATLMEEHITEILTSEEASALDRAAALEAIYTDGYQNNIAILLRYFQNHMQWSITSLNGTEQFASILIDILQGRISDYLHLNILSDIIKSLNVSSSHLLGKALLLAEKERRFWKARSHEIQKYLERFQIAT